MKLQDLMEAEVPSIKDTLLKGIDEAMVRHAMLADIEITEDEAMYTIMYEFPEHRTGLPAQVRKIVKSIGTMTTEKGNEGSYFGTSYQITFKTPIESSEAKEITAAIKSRYKDDIWR